jgi:hypothetical protein
MKIGGRSDRTIEPGKTETVEVTITANAKGPSTRKVRVLTNDRKTPNAELTCTAVAKSALQLDAPMVNFGDISRDAADNQVKSIIIKRGDAGPISPRVASTGNEKITAEIKELEAGESYELVVTIHPPWPSGLLRGNLVLETGIEQAATESLPVSARIAARLTANPNRFSVPQQHSNDMDLRATLAWSHDKAPGNVTAVHCTDPGLSAEMKEQDATTVVILHIPADYEIKAGTRNAVVVSTDDSESPTLEIPVYPIRSSPTVQPASAPAARPRVTPVPPPAPATDPPQPANAPAKQ